MFKTPSRPTSLRRTLWAATAAIAAIVALPQAAAAGACPADQMRTGARAADTTPAKDVTDTVIASIDVAKEPAMIDGRLFRMRRLVIEPGGVVPWHSHADRPAIIYVVQGEVTEFASTCAAPIVHKAGDVTPELHATSHWWRNTGAGQAVLLSADLLRAD